VPSHGLRRMKIRVFAGANPVASKNELQVNCQWKDKQSDITRGCTSVLSTLQFKTVK
jgi:hypothetical protein